MLRRLKGTDGGTHKVQEYRFLHPFSGTNNDSPLFKDGSDEKKEVCEAPCDTWQHKCKTDTYPQGTRLCGVGSPATLSATVSRSDGRRVHRAAHRTEHAKAVDDLADFRATRTEFF